MYERTLKQYRGADWRPIATAPKDWYEDILAWDENEKEMMVVYWDGQSWCLDEHVRCLKPTHWQPLPAPPEVK